MLLDLCTREMVQFMQKCQNQWATTEPFPVRQTSCRPLILALLHELNHFPCAEVQQHERKATLLVLCGGVTSNPSLLFLSHTQDGMRQAIFPPECSGVFHDQPFRSPKHMFWIYDFTLDTCRQMCNV